MIERDSNCPLRLIRSVALSSDARPYMDNHPDDTLVVYSMEEAARRSSIPRSSLYAMIKRGELHTTKSGRRRLVPAASLRKLVGAA